MANETGSVTATEKTQSPESGAKPLDSTHFEVFDGTPKEPAIDAAATAEANRESPKVESEAASSTASNTAASDTKPTKKRGKGKKAPDLTPEQQKAAADAKLEEARGLIRALAGMQVASWYGQFKEYIPHDELRSILKEAQLSDEDVDTIAGPLSQGMVEEEIEMPWWATLGLVTLSIYSTKRAPVYQRLKHEAQKNAPVDAEVTHRD